MTGMFDEAGDPAPLTAEIAVRRGMKCVYPISGFFTFLAVLLFLPATIVYEVPEWIFYVVAASVWYASWVVLFRHWRRWALRGGCEAEELEEEGELYAFIPERGSLLWYLGWPAYAP